MAGVASAQGREELAQGLKPQAGPASAGAKPMVAQAQPQAPAALLAVKQAQGAPLAQKPNEGGQPPGNAAGNPALHTHAAHTDDVRTAAVKEPSAINAQAVAPMVTHHAITGEEAHSSKSHEAREKALKKTFNHAKKAKKAELNSVKLERAKIRKEYVEQSNALRKEAKESWLAYEKKAQELERLEFELVEAYAAPFAELDGILANNSQVTTLVRDVRRVGEEELKERLEKLKEERRLLRARHADHIESLIQTHLILDASLKEREEGLNSRSTKAQDVLKERERTYEQESAIAKKRLLAD